MDVVRVGCTVAEILLLGTALAERGWEHGDTDGTSPLQRFTGFYKSNHVGARVSITVYPEIKRFVGHSGPHSEPCIGYAEFMRMLAPNED